MSYTHLGSSGLRRELSHRAHQFATIHHYLHETTNGSTPSVIFGLDESGRHGNFQPASHTAIQANPHWAERLGKAHTASKRHWLRSERQWRELDCANSSDALLMNIFCHPETLSSARTRLLLGVGKDCAPIFGYKPRTPLRNGRFDATEIDMKLENVLIEAKLTETDFQTAPHHLILRYRHVEEIFDVAELPTNQGKVAGYQLLRGTLAAHATGAAFCVLCDERRHDLIEAWYRILCTVRLAELRCRLKLLTWQELASTLPIDLQTFLALKYGIADAAASLQPMPEAPLPWDSDAAPDRPIRHTSRSF